MDELELDLRELDAPPVEKDAPWFFRVGRALARRNVRGATRLLEEARKRGLLDVLVDYPLCDQVHLRVPIWRPCNSWDREDVLGYEASFLRLFAGCVGSLGRDTVLVDCGADIGTVSAHICARCTNVNRIVAFEPNPAAYKVLAVNLRSLPISTEPRHAAVSDFTGRGRLASPARDPSAHACYLERAPEGPVAVERIDDLGLAPGRPLALKIDVEGGELLVVEGAHETIEKASAVAIAFEAHPGVTKRTGIDPMVVMRRLRELRSDLAFYVDTTPARVLDPERPVFEQVRPDDVYNIVAITMPSV
jgi:FkbM family methyltransferase